MVPFAAAIPQTIPRTALVTGAARRLGRAMALGLAEAGFAVAVHSHTNTAEAEATCAAIQRLGRATMALRADLAREAEVARLLPDAAAALGPIGVLVNNA
ncbi:MAG TPA: SDR family NAD(P)-dependent oxidoreductase, partial [Acetobacteraceae bacterium]|nr:SDR family NAD(P)-dependent oxidoreductase [Acetobacteraceae bacterium]